jgi:hypothetical protein
MSEIELLDPSDAPFIRLTLSRDEAEVVTAALFDAPFETGVEADIAYDLFDSLNAVLDGPEDSEEDDDDVLDGDPYYCDDCIEAGYDNPDLADFDDEGNYVGF